MIKPKQTQINSEPVFFDKNLKFAGNTKMLLTAADYIVIINYFSLTNPGLHDILHI